MIDSNYIPYLSSGNWKDFIKSVGRLNLLESSDSKVSLLEPDLSPSLHSELLTANASIGIDFGLF